MQLRSHPMYPPSSDLHVEVDGGIVHGVTRLRYRVTGGLLRLPEAVAAERTDGLWQTTCFELFVRPAGGEGYCEFNFSPSTQWAAYAFDGYRAGMRALELPPPVIVPLDDGVDVEVDLSGLPAGPWQVGVTAVIEEPDGTRSFWALAHPGERPDFHHADGFVLAIA